MKTAQLKQNKGMVDISQKDITRRTAVACGRIRMSKEAFNALLKGKSPKGDVLQVAKLAGIMAAKETPRIIPLCHPLQLNKVSVDFKIDKRRHSIEIVSEVICLGRTGVEMEALAAAVVSALTVYDMMKWADKSMTISDVCLLKKTGGKSGDYLKK
ncbi:MAG: molybdenum cofactor biosynthesis protein C [Omnitrophica WOR_2 bacterium GWA2_47_8]|nr:MAG: molybdenum cofactor biosynthesis protein C [Omnitrophica WOR_2 bacterium GWA2_47_8]